MAVSSCDIEMVTRNQFSFTGFILACNKKKVVEGITYQAIHFSVHSKHNDTNFKSEHHCNQKL